MAQRLLQAEVARVREEGPSIGVAQQVLSHSHTITQGSFLHLLGEEGDQLHVVRLVLHGVRLPLEHNPLLQSAQRSHQGGLCFCNR